MVDTIETDARSPFRAPEEPPAEWIWRDWLDNAAERGQAFVSAYLAMAGDRAGVVYRELPAFPRGASLERTVDAFVNHGRWLWGCPICNAAQVCSPADPRAWCIECFNGGDGWWPIDFPAEQDEIETLLDRRPKVEQRNWEPAEQVEQLQAENLSIGVDPDLPGRPWPGAQAALDLVREHLALGQGEYVPALTEAAGREAAS